MKIKPGKIYLTRDGERVLIQADTGRRGAYRMQGIYLAGGNFAGGCVTHRDAEGRFEGKRDDQWSKLDLISEVA